MLIIAMVTLLAVSLEEGNALFVFFFPFFPFPLLLQPWPDSLDSPAFGGSFEGVAGLSLRNWPDSL